jgi:hypothetical protein
MTLSDSKLALRWGCDVRTIRRWRKAGAPLASAKKLAVWLTARKNLPPGTEAILSGQAAKVMGKASASSESEGNTGAAGALRRLESAERVTYKMLQTALKSGSAPAIKTARENWLAIGNQLRQYDLAVARDRRDSGELIPRSEMELAAEGFMYWLRMAARPAAAKMAGILLASRDYITISDAIREQFWDDMISALAAMVGQPGKLRVPAWWIASAIKGIDGAFADIPGALAKRQHALRACEMVVATNAGLRVATYVATATGPVTTPPAIAPATPDTAPTHPNEQAELDSLEAQLAVIEAAGRPDKAPAEITPATPDVNAA